LISSVEVIFCLLSKLITFKKNRQLKNIENNGAATQRVHIPRMRLKDNPFRKWMDDNKLSAAELAGPLGVSVQTIHNWRSAGVPPRRKPFIKDTMARWHVISGRPMNSIVVVADQKQFEQWSEAALASGKTLVSWATEGLDEMALKYLEHSKHRGSLKSAKAAKPIFTKPGSAPCY
jgi:DNA-binding transcriptional regulator YiaG